jgi:hypothetical protein
MYTIDCREWQYTSTFSWRSCVGLYIILWVPFPRTLWRCEIVHRALIAFLQFLARRLISAVLLANTNYLFPVLMQCVQYLYYRCVHVMHKNRELRVHEMRRRTYTCFHIVPILFVVAKAIP